MEGITMVMKAEVPVEQRGNEDYQEVFRRKDKQGRYMWKTAEQWAAIDAAEKAKKEAEEKAAAKAEKAKKADSDGDGVSDADEAAGKAGKAKK